MKSAVVVGYDIFANDEASLYDLNLIQTLTTRGYQVSFYNYVNFRRHQVRGLLRKCSGIYGVSFRRIKRLEDIQDADLIYITSVRLWELVGWLRKRSPQANIIGRFDAISSNTIEIAETYGKVFNTVFVGDTEQKKLLSKWIELWRICIHPGVVAVDENLPESIPERVDTKGMYNVILPLSSKQRLGWEYGVRVIDWLVHVRKFENIQLMVRPELFRNSAFRQLIQLRKIDHFVSSVGDFPENYTLLVPYAVPGCDEYTLSALSTGHGVISNFSKMNNDSVNSAGYYDCVNLKYDIDKDAMQIESFLRSKEQLRLIYKNINRVQSEQKSFFRDSEAPNSILDNSTNSSYPAFGAILTHIATNMKCSQPKGLRLYYNKLRQVPIVGFVIRRVRPIVLRLLKLGRKHIANQVIFQTDANQLFVESFHGQSLAGDPKYLALSFKERNPDAKIYVSAANELVDLAVEAYGLIPVRTGALAYVNAFRHSRYVVMNGNSLDLAGKQPDQIFVQTWHGFPLKRMVNDLADPAQREEESEAFAPRMKKWDYLTVSSLRQRKLLSSAFKLEANQKLNILNSGAPRNEYLMAHSADLEERNRLFIKYFNRPYDSEQRFVLYTPTWRKKQRNRVARLDLVQLVQYLPSNYSLIVKLHPLEGQLITEYQHLSERIYCFNNELIDIQELFLLGDCLITDYSSAMFDFAHTGKPIIILQEDEEAYRTQIGYYFDLKRETGLVGKAYSEKELASAILHTDSHESDLQIQQKMMNFDHVGSASEIWTVITEHS